MRKSFVQLLLLVGLFLKVPGQDLTETTNTEMTGKTETSPTETTNSEITGKTENSTSISTGTPTTTSTGTPTTTSTGTLTTTSTGTPTTTSTETPTTTSRETPTTTSTTTITTTATPTIPDYSSCGKNCQVWDINDPIDQEYLLYCCGAFSLCCNESDHVPCPSSGHSCSPVGPFCNDDSRCSIGEKCCVDNSVSSEKKCCWSPLYGRYKGYRQKPSSIHV